MKRLMMTTLLAAALIAPPMMTSAATLQSQKGATKMELKEQKAKDKWEQAEVKYGKDSKQAMKAKAKYDKIVAEHKGERKGERESRLNTPSNTATR